jgi:hypothetical protein
LNHTKNNIIGYENYPANFKTCFPFLIASVVYHRQWLVENLSRHHPIFLSRLFTDGHAERLQPKVLLGIGFCKETGLAATGIPHHLVISHNVNELRGEVTTEMDHMKRKFNVLENTLCSRFEEIPTKVTEVMRSNFEINGAVAVTRHDIDCLLQELRSEMRNISSPSNERPFSQSNHQQEEMHPPSESQQNFIMYSWNGHFHMVPSGFRFPITISTKLIWDLWYFGNIDETLSIY